MNKERNSIEYKVSGKYALFTDPITKLGGEKSTYLIPTYQALKGITESIYYKPTLIWIIDKVRVMNKIRTQSKGAKPLKYNNGGNDLAWYTYLYDVEYQVSAHFEWNKQRQDLIPDQNKNKHSDIAKRCIERGGRRDIFLGTRECQGYVEPCVFGEGKSAYSDEDEIAFGCMFHSFDYPTEIGGKVLKKSLWFPKMVGSVIEFIRPDQISETMKQEVKDYYFNPIQCSGKKGTDELYQELFEGDKNESI